MRKATIGFDITICFRGTTTVVFFGFSGNTIYEHFSKIVLIKFEKVFKFVILLCAEEIFSYNLSNHGL